MKLVLTYSWGGEPCSGISHVSFEYESKEKFVFDILEKYKDKKWIQYDENNFEEIQIFPDVWMNKIDVESIEHSVHTLDEWFNENKIKIRL